MALTIVPTTYDFNGNVGAQKYVSDSIGSKCLCCPYGYHIDLDFVRYCEAVAAGSANDRLSTERRRKRERRRQCQSMEVLLGLVNPALAGIEAELTKIPQECMTVNSGITLSRSNHPSSLRTDSRPSLVLDLSDVVGDFEATLKRSSRSSKISERRFLVEIGRLDVCRDSCCETRRGSRRCVAGTTCFRLLYCTNAWRGNAVQLRYPAIALPLHCHVDVQHLPITTFVVTTLINYIKAFV